MVQWFKAERNHHSKVYLVLAGRVVDTGPLALDPGGKSWKECRKELENDGWTIEKLEALSTL